MCTDYVSVDPLAAAAISGTTFPASKNAPLLTPPSSQPNQKWPVMVFSHGVGCSRLMYSAFCGELASRGYVVCAIEHRDGTSPSSKITSEDGTTQTLDWLQWSDLQWPEETEQPKDDTHLRHEQIAFRCAEIEGVLATMRKVTDGEDVVKRSLTAPDFDWARWRGALDVSSPVMAGHSLGGSAALAISAKQTVNWAAVLVFDPAVQRLAPWTAHVPHPLLVVNSEEFTVGAEYRIFAEQIAATVGKPGDDDQPLVFSVPGATHPSFSDVFLILPEYVNRMTGLRVDAGTVVSLTVAACSDFLRGKSAEIKKRAVIYRPDPVQDKLHVTDGRDVGEGGQPEKVGEVPKPYKPVGNPGQLIWHTFEGI
jgi:platelet-activating factor acetylhydrolase